MGLFLGQSPSCQYGSRPIVLPGKGGHPRPIVDCFGITVKQLDAILRGFFFLPILLGGVVGFALIEPEFRTYGIVCGILLSLFFLVVVLQFIFERRALHDARRKAMAVAKQRPKELAADQ